MKESGVASFNMPFTDRMTPTELPAEKNGMKMKTWRNRIGLFLKPNSSKHTKNISHRPSPDDLNQWAQSFDKLLSHEYGKAFFLYFSKTEYCEENLEFWTACEDLKTITSHTKLVSKANSMYEEFIRDEAPKEINLDFHTKNAITQSLHDLSASSFLAAQLKVYSLMENNSYPRFIHSDLYRELCATCTADQP